MQTIVYFTQEERARLMAADSTSLAIANSWNLRTQFEWEEVGQINLGDLMALPGGYKDIDELIKQFLADKQEWNQHFADFISDFGLAALIAAKDDLISTSGRIIGGELVAFWGNDPEADYFYIRHVFVNFRERLISIVLRH